MEVKERAGRCQKWGNGMKHKNLIKYLIPIACILWGAVFAGISLKEYDLFERSKGPMTGFMPVLIGSLLIIVGIIALFQASDSEDAVMEKENWYLVAGVLIVIAGSYIIGILPGGYLLAFWWLKYKERYSWKTVIAVMLFLIVLIIGVFVFWLKIPFQYGVIGNAIMKAWK